MYFFFFPFPFHFFFLFFLPETAGLALRLKKSKGVTSADGALNVTNDGAIGVVEELNADLSNITTVTSAAYRDVFYD
jgi:hypothetical protein